jgi:hypothetical protein
VTIRPYCQLADYWKSQGLSLPSGNLEETVRDFETRCAVTFPPDLREYLLNIDGMRQVGGHDCDANGFAFWPLARIKNIVTIYREESKAPPGLHEEDQYYVFADYLQWSWAYAIRLSNRPSEPNHVIHVGTVLPKIIAASFTDFVDLYLQDAPALYPDPK